MDLLFSFHEAWFDGGKSIITVNLYKVSISDRGHEICMTELGCDHPITWTIKDAGDMALLRSWLIRNALGGEIFIQGEQ